MRNTMFSLLLTLHIVLLGCVTENDSSREATEARDNAEAAQMVWHTVHNIMVTASDVQYTLNMLNERLVSGPDSSLCPLTRSELRGSTGAVGTSFASLPTSSATLSLFDTRFDSMYAQYSHCTPFSASALKAFSFVYSRQKSTTRREGNIGLFFMTEERCVRYVQRYWSGETCSDFTENSHLQVAAGAAELRASAAEIQSGKPIGKYRESTLIALLVAGHTVSAPAFTHLAGYEPLAPKEVCKTLFDILWAEGSILPSEEESARAQKECQKYP